MSAWARAGFLGSLRWADEVYDQFGHLEDLSNASDAADEIIRILGIPSASTETRQQLEGWWSAHEGEFNWAIRHNAVIVGGMTPEMHVA